MLRATLLLVALAMLPAACGRPAATRLRIGMNPWPGYASLAVAQHRGLFARHGIDAQLVEYVSLHDLRRGFAEGQIDVLPSTLVEVMALSTDANRAPVIAWVADASNGADIVVARGTTDARGLRGKAIGYEPATLGSFMLARFLAIHGMTGDDVQAVGMDQGRMAQAMAEGRIAAAITYPPHDAAMLALPDTRTIFTSRQLPDEIIDTVSIASDVLAANPGLLARFQQALIDTDQFCRNEPAAARAIMQGVTGMRGEDFTAAIGGVTVYGPGDQPGWLGDESRLQQLANRTAATLGTAPRRVRVASPADFAAPFQVATPR